MQTKPSCNISPIHSKALAASLLELRTEPVASSKPVLSPNE